MGLQNGDRYSEVIVSSGLTGPTIMFFFQISGFHCFPYSVHYDPEHGHYVRAVRDIQPGEIILVSPRSFDHYHRTRS